MEFVASVLASVVAGVLLLLTTPLVSGKARWVLTATLGRILDIDIEYVFANQLAAASDIRKELERAKTVALLTSRGIELQRETFATLFQDLQRKRHTRVLLPLISAQNNRTRGDWIAHRENELSKFDASFTPGLLRQQIQTTITSVEQHIQNGILELRLYDSPHIARILITDRYAYLTPYETDAHGRDTRVIKYQRGGDMYAWLERIFNQLWEASVVHIVQPRSGAS